MGDKLVIISKPCRGPGGRRCKPGDEVLLHANAATAYVSRGDARFPRKVVVPEVKVVAEPPPPKPKPKPKPKTEPRSPGSPYECPICQKPYKLKRSLERHLSNYHGE